MIAVVAPDRDVPLAVMQAVQGPPPGKPVLGAMHPVGSKVIKREIDQERGERIVAQPREQPLQPGRRKAPGADQMLDLVGHRIGHDENRQRNDAELVQRRVNPADADQPVVAPCLQRPAAFEQPHDQRNDRDLDDAQHDELDGVEGRLVPFHQVGPEQEGADDGLEQPGLDGNPEVDELAHRRGPYFESASVDAARTGRPAVGPGSAFRMNTPCGDLPTAMLPTTLSVAMSTTAMRRRKRCVTQSSLPSGVMSMQSGPPGTRMVLTTAISCVSISDTVPSMRLLRNQCRPSPLGQKLCAPLPVCRRPVTEPSFGSITTRPSSPVSATRRRLLSGNMATPAGALPTSTFHLIICVARSNATTRPLCCSVTNTVLESLSNPRWLGMPSMTMRPMSLKPSARSMSA